MDWMKDDHTTSLQVNPVDAAALGVDDGGHVRLTTKGGSVQCTVEITDRIREGTLSLPNGLGMRLWVPDIRRRPLTKGKLVPPDGCRHRAIRQSGTGLLAV